MMIKPTVGRIVYYFRGPGAEEMAAIITRVHDFSYVDVTVFKPGDVPMALTSVALRQPEDLEPDTHHVAWMPYQQTESFGSESGERAAGKV